MDVARYATVHICETVTVEIFKAWFSDCLPVNTENRTSICYVCVCMISFPKPSCFHNNNRELKELKKINKKMRKHTSVQNVKINIFIQSNGKHKHTRSLAHASCVLTKRNS